MIAEYMGYKKGNPWQVATDQAMYSGDKQLVVFETEIQALYPVASNVKTMTRKEAYEMFIKEVIANSPNNDMTWGEYVEWLIQEKCL